MTGFALPRGVWERDECGFVVSSSYAPRGNSCCEIGGSSLLSLEKYLRNGQIKA